MAPRSRISSALAAPLWAGEAEVVRTYWRCDRRSAATDLQWLARQSFKEFWGSGVSKFDRGGMFFGMMKNLLAQRRRDRRHARPPRGGRGARDGARRSSRITAPSPIATTRSARPARRALNPERLESWPEEDALTALRYRHQEQHGALGMRACKFTEGGYCTLVQRGHGAARAAAASTSRSPPPAPASMPTSSSTCWPASPASRTKAWRGAIGASWARSSSSSSRQRIRMRNQQFGGPLSDARVAAIYRGEIAPIAFDWARAGLE